MKFRAFLFEELYFSCFCTFSFPPSLWLHPNVGSVSLQQVLTKVAWQTTLLTFLFLSATLIVGNIFATLHAEIFSYYYI